VAESKVNKKWIVCELQRHYGLLPKERSWLRRLSEETGESASVLSRRISGEKPWPAEFVFGMARLLDTTAHMIMFQIGGISSEEYKRIQGRMGAGRTAT
jgi:hypothetical protein